MTKRYPDKDTRRERAYRRLGTRNPVCIGCGFAGQPEQMELAHIAPRGFHDNVGVLCRNCHGLQSDAEKDYP